jgi:hypothetical protein
MLCGQVCLSTLTHDFVTLACTNMDDWARHTTTFWKKVILLPALRRNCCPLRLRSTIQPQLEKGSLGDHSGWVILTVLWTRKRSSLAFVFCSTKTLPCRTGVQMSNLQYDLWPSRISPIHTVHNFRSALSAFVKVLPRFVAMLRSWQTVAEDWLNVHIWSNSSGCVLLLVFSTTLPS